MQVYNDELYHFGVKGMRWKKKGVTSISKDEYRLFNPDPNYVISRKPLTDDHLLKTNITDNRILRKTPINNDQSKNTTKSIIPIKTMIPINSTPEQTKAIKDKLAKQGYILSGQNIVKKLYSK